MTTTPDNPLGLYLRDRRTRLDPGAFGFPIQRRRTPGLRREEVAQRANISPTWYTWLEQGRGGAPSPDVLNRIAGGLMLTEAEREHLFMLALGRPPEVRYRAANSVTPRLQRLLDGMLASPAIIKTATWDNDRVRGAQEDWESTARFVVGAFRADAVRAGAVAEVGQLVTELCATSPEFAALWADNDVRFHGEGTKRLHHPVLGAIELEYSGFAVDGRPDLGMIVYNPVDPDVADRIRAMLAG
jgi:transcriptional regulator with XRE-family HTH domain